MDESASTQTADAAIAAAHRKWYFGDALGALAVLDRCLETAELTDIEREAVAKMRLIHVRTADPEYLPPAPDQDQFARDIEPLSMKVHDSIERRELSEALRFSLMYLTRCDTLSDSMFFALGRFAELAVRIRDFALAEACARAYLSMWELRRCLTTQHEPLYAEAVGPEWREHLNPFEGASLRTCAQRAFELTGNAFWSEVLAHPGVIRTEQ
jgi:hypothetical protein